MPATAGISRRGVPRLNESGREEPEAMFWEILIGAAVMTLVTVLFTGPGMWSSSWGFRKREDAGKQAPRQDK